VGLKNLDLFVVLVPDRLSIDADPEKFLHLKRDEYIFDVRKRKNEDAKSNVKSASNANRPILFSHSSQIKL